MLGKRTSIRTCASFCGLLLLAWFGLVSSAIAQFRTPDIAQHPTLSAEGPASISEDQGAGAETNASASGDSTDSKSQDTGTAPTPQELKSQRFQWKPAIAQYWFEVSIQHAWRFAHENGTRDATGYGPWFNDWIDSIGETRGWDDGDGWHASYVGHTLNGGIYGFIEQNNDPLYRKVEWGDGRIYWMSRLRAFAFSAVASTQWTLGPMSEASLGNVQLHASPGFIDLVNTPGLGTFEMMGEDLLDRYVIIPVENHVANPWILLTVRSLGNPARSFANLMAFKFGWTRENRIGIFGENHKLRKQLVSEYKQGLTPAPFGPHTPAEKAAMNATVEKPHPAEAPLEIQAYAIYEGFLNGHNCFGGGGQAAVRIRPAWQIVSEVNGCMVVGTPYDQSADSVTFSAGARWTPRPTRRFSPFTQVLFGGRRMTYEVQNSQLGNQLSNAWNDGNGGTLHHYPKRNAYQAQYQALGPNLTVGGGVDAAFSRAFAWRVLDVNYSHAWLPEVHGVNASNGLQVRTGVVLRIGNW